VATVASARSTDQEVMRIFIISEGFPPTMDMERPMTTFLTLGGRIRCRQCAARSKRTKMQCRSPALKGKQVCRIHGGKSTGPKTDAGRQRIAAANTVHGRETREIRSARRVKIAELEELEALGRQIGLISGSKTRGPKIKQSGM